MIEDDFETEMLQEEAEKKEESTSNKFHLSSLNHPLLKLNENNILSISTSKKYIYILKENSELILFESKTLRPIMKSFKIPPPQNNSKFTENLTKIWSDREGNHNIIRHNGSIFYFNSNFGNIKELKNFKNVEICALALDDRNTDEIDTKNFLAVDYVNKIYECNIKIEKKDSDIYIKDKIEKLTIFNFTDWEYEDDEDKNPNNPFYTFNVKDRIYDLRFFRATKCDLGPNENACYIMAVSKNRFYQFIGPGLNSFKQIFGRYDLNSYLFNDSCKIFPPITRNKNNKTNLNILFKFDQRITGDKTSTKCEVLSQFGWKTDTGYCFGHFSYDNNLKSTGLPYDQKTFTVMPFSKITRQGDKRDGLEPIDIMHTNNHIFLLYEDCLTVISKLTSYIIHTQYFNTEIQYNQIIYHEFAEENGIILLTSSNGLFQISLEDENKDIWKDYLEIGNYNKAQLYCPSERLRRRIYRIEAEYELNELKNGFNSASRFANSDEKFENICLKYLMINDIQSLRIYLELYMASNLNKEDKLQFSLISTWMVELFLNQLQLNTINDKSALNDFRQIIRDNREYLDPELINELLIDYGRMNEYIEFGSLLGDFEKVILYYIHHDEIDIALDKIEWFMSFSDDEEVLKKLSQIFSDYSHIFFKKSPKKAISILNQNYLKYLKMELIIRAIASTTEKYTEDNDIKKIYDKKSNEERKKELENNQAIVEYLRTLIDKPKNDQENNIHNLFIYYLSKNQYNHLSLIEYLKVPLKNEENEINIIFNRKKGVLFNLDYAKKLFKKKPPELSLILALMGKYQEGVKEALKNPTEECQQIAKFIASNAPGEKLRKKLWIDIFSNNSQNEFKQALDVIKESKILKIEDVLPYITDNITIENFKLQISDCIKEYENNITSLKENINDYNVAAENIKLEINKIKKKSMEIANNNCKCDICHKPIEDKKLFLFPCGHMFDMFCMRDYLLDYEVTGIGYLHNKNVEIDELLFKLEYSSKKIFSKKEPVIKKESDMNQDNQENIQFLERARINKSKPPIQKIALKRVKNYRQINNLKKKLFDILSEQCVLCGDFMVDSVQYSLDQKDVFEPDNKGLSLQIEREPDFEF